jgi:hypothetical protein
METVLTGPTLIPATVLLMSCALAFGLELLERRYPAIHPDWIWLEVVAGTIIMLGPPLLLWNALGVTTAHELATLIWQCVFCAGGPIVVWQLVLMRMGRENARPAK